MTEKLRSGVYADVRNMCKEIGGKESNVDLDQNATDLIAELVWKKLLLYGGDLESFAKHGKRAAISADDVKLLCRRNISLMEFLEKECRPVNSKLDAPSINKRKRKVSAIIIDD